MDSRIFIHGLESSSQGTKGAFFRRKYPRMIIPTFEGPLPQRMRQLRNVLAGETSIVVVGSSFGGLMGTLFALENEPRVRRLVLLAPAINLMPFGLKKGQITVPVSIYHGSHDEVIPLKEVRSTAERLFANLSFHAVDDDHFLHATFTTIDWDTHLL